MTGRLTGWQLSIAAKAGVAVWLKSRIDKRQDQHGYRGDDLIVHVEGNAAELFVANKLNRYWEPQIDRFKAGDIGDDLQVRHTNLKDGSLIVRRKDPVGHTYLLVVGDIFGELRLAGWIRGVDARQGEWWRAPGGRPGAWFIPQAELQFVGSLPAPQRTGHVYYVEGDGHDCYTGMDGDDNEGVNREPAGLPAWEG